MGFLKLAHKNEFSRGNLKLKEVRNREFINKNA